MPIIVNNTHGSNSVRYSFQRKIFKRNGQFYLFWADDISGSQTLFYRFAGSIAALVDASSHQAVNPAHSDSQFGDNYDVLFDADHDRVGIAWMTNIEANASRLYFKIGTFASDGTINWGEESLVDPQAYPEFDNPVLGRSASGRWGIFLKRTGDDGAIAVPFYSASTATPGSGDWQDRGNQVPGDPGGSYAAYRISQVGLNGDDLLLIYKGENRTLVARRWNGTSLGDPKVAEVNIREQTISAPVIDSAGNVHLVCFDNRSNPRFHHLRYQSANNTWLILGSFTSPAGDDTQSPALQIDGEDRLHLFFKNHDQQRMHYLTYADGAWSDATSGLSGELAAGYQDLRQTPVSAAYGADEVMVAWSNEASNRNELWMAGLPLTPAVGPTADFNANPTTGTVPLAVQFSDQSTAGTNPITSWQWDFGDGGTSSEQNPQHIYATAGTYTVKLTVSDGTLSDTEVKQNYITVPAVVGPTAGFSANPTSGTAPLTVQFSNQSLQGTHPIASWQWDFGDGGTSNEENPTHVYTNPGTYTVKLTVSDGTLSNSIEKSNLITVAEVVTGPTANFSANPTSGTAPLKVQFSDQSTAGTNPISSWQWDLGDGGSSTAQNPAHIYQKKGPKTVKLTVSDGTHSDSKVRQHYISVEGEPEVECPDGRIRAMLSYLFGAFSGLFFFLFDKNKCVRFHALQSLITFGIIFLLLWLGHWVFFWPDIVIYAILAVTIPLWFFLMMMALRGKLFRLPIIGDFAYKTVFGKD